MSGNTAPWQLWCNPSRRSFPQHNWDRMFPNGWEPCTINLICIDCDWRKSTIAGYSLVELLERTLPLPVVKRTYGVIRLTLALENYHPSAWVSFLTTCHQKIAFHVNFFATVLLLLLLLLVVVQCGRPPPFCGQFVWFVVPVALMRPFDPMCLPR